MQTDCCVFRIMNDSGVNAVSIFALIPIRLHCPMLALPWNWKLIPLLIADCEGIIPSKNSPVAADAYCSVAQWVDCSFVSSLVNWNHRPMIQKTTLNFVLHSRWSATYPTFNCLRVAPLIPMGYIAIWIPCFRDDPQRIQHSIVFALPPWSRCVI